MVRAPFPNRLAFVVSGLSSPYLVVAVFGLLPIPRYAPSLATAALWAACYLAGAVGVPFAYVFYQVRRHRLTDFHVGLRRQRSRPILAALVGAGACLAAFVCLGAPKELLAMLEALILDGTVCLAATSLVKVSFHTGTFVGSILTAGMLLSPYCLLMLAALPLIAWARAYRGRHTVAESAWGGAIAALSATCAFGLNGLL